MFSFFRSSGKPVASTSSGTQDAVTFFYDQSLRNILERVSRKETSLIQSCTEILQHTSTFKEKQLVLNEMKENPSMFFTPLKLACETKDAQVAEHAIDCLQKMIAYGYINSQMKYKEDESKMLLDVVVATICAAFEPMQENNLQLQILKALLAAVTSGEVHGKSLRITVKTCFNIHLVSKSVINQKTAKAILTQVLNLVFQKMESQYKDGLIDINDEGDVSTASSTFDLSDNEEDMEEHEQLTLQRSNSDKKLKTVQQSDEQIISEFVHKVINDVLVANGGTMIDLTTTKPLNGSQSDAFFLFKALCRISMQELPSADLNADSIEMRSRILSLELIQIILHNSGPAFRNSQIFIRDIKFYLCLSLLKNCISTHPAIFKLSLNIFKALIIHFKGHLKAEIGMFFTNAFLRILESHNSTYQQKVLVIKVLHSICKDPQTLVDLFVNYDCALESVNVYETMVSDLSRAVQQGHVETNWVSPAQESNIKKNALENVVCILASLVEWMKTKTTVSADRSQSPGNETNDDESTTSDETQFEKLRHKKMDMNEGVKEFNKKPTRGLQYLIDTGNLANDPQEIAKFLQTNRALDKAMIGQLIGGHDEFSSKIRHAFVDYQSFTGKDFETALRAFLNTHRLPGEAQMIDRLLQKFAEKYYKDNTDSVFANADAAYVFSYAVIMLNVELHSPALAYRDRMTLQGFITNNEGQNDGGNFPEDYQAKIYNAIKNKELTLKDEEHTKEDIDREIEQQNISTRKKKQLLFDLESKQIYRKSKSILAHSKTDRKKESSGNVVFYSATGITHVRSMFEVTWGPILAAISVILESSEDPEMVSLCLSALEHGIHISARFDLATERNAFVAALAKFTNLNNLTRMMQKNLDCIHLLLKVAEAQGNYLRGSWSHVLECISLLDRLKLLKVSAESNGDIAPRKQSQEYTRQLMKEQLNSQIISSIDSTVVDKIFAKSADLSDDAIVDFVKCLCAVAHEEVNLQDPREFSVQRIIDVAYYNMKRIKIVWSRIWVHMSELFISVGCHSNPNISVLAIDSLKQMATQFLEQDELANYHFQRDFIRPFLEIMKRCKQHAVRDMVVNCTGYMVMKRAKNIKSGWKIILQILSLAAKLGIAEIADKSKQMESSDIVGLAFNCVAMIINDYFHLVSESFEDCIACLSVFARQQIRPAAARKAIDYMKVCAKKLVSGSVEGFVVTQQDGEPDGVYFTDSKEHLKIWFPILTGLSQITSDPRSEVRTVALEVLFDILTEFGSTFSQSLWELIFTGVLFPIFDEIKHQDDEIEELEKQELAKLQRESDKKSQTASIVLRDSEWIRTSCHKALSLLVNLFSNFFDRLSFMFNGLLNLISTCFKKSRPSDVLCQIGSSCFVQLIVSSSPKFSSKDWDLVFSQLKSITSVMNAPANLQQATAAANLTPMVIANIEIQCKTQLLLIESIGEIFNAQYETITTAHAEKLLLILFDLYESAKNFNESDACVNLKRVNDRIPFGQFIQQEVDSLSIYIKSLYRMFVDRRETAQDRREYGSKHLFQMIEEVITRYLVKCSIIQPPTTSYKSNNKLEMLALIPMVSLALTTYMALPDDLFMLQINHLYPLCCELVLSQEDHKNEIRQTVKEILLRYKALQS